MKKRGWQIIILFLLLVFSVNAEEIMFENDKKIMEFDGKTLTIEVLVISEIQDQVLLRVNNNLIKLKPAESRETEDALIILKDIIKSGKNTQKSIARLFIIPKTEALTIEVYEVNGTSNEYDLNNDLVNINSYYGNIRSADESEDIIKMLMERVEKKESEEKSSSLQYEPTLIQSEVIKKIQELKVEELNTVNKLALFATISFITLLVMLITVRLQHGKISINQMKRRAKTKKIRRKR